MFDTENLYIFLNMIFFIQEKYYNMQFRFYLSYLLYYNIYIIY